MTIVYDLVPFERCGPIVRGLAFDRAGGVIGMRVSPFRKSSFAAHEALDAEGRMHLFFSGEGRCKGVEIFAGSGIGLSFRGSELPHTDAMRLTRVLEELGQPWRRDTYGIHAEGLGLATFHPDFDWEAGARSIDAIYVSLDPAFVP